MTFRYLEGYCNDDTSTPIAREDAGKPEADTPTEEPEHPDDPTGTAHGPGDGPDPERPR